MAPHAFTPRTDPLTLSHRQVLGQKLLTALLRENIAGWDREPECHSDFGWCVVHQGHLLPLKPDGLWHTHQARTGQVWDIQNACWKEALDVLETLHLPGFAELLQEHQAALEFMDFRKQHREKVLGDSRSASQVGWEGFRFYDRLASLLDHPIYPLPARLGLSGEDLLMYSPETSPGFELCWVAVPGKHVVLAGPQPAFFPTFAQVGLPDLPDQVLLPVHPHTLPHLSDLLERQEGRVAPQAFLRVFPALSLRTLVVQDHPGWHLKVPLQVRTLGFKNLRTLHPDSFADGAHMQQVLAHLNLPGVQFTREDHYGHTGTPDLGYLVRTQPEASPETRMVALAGLLAPHPAGQTVLEHLTSSPQRFLRELVEKLVRFHLTLALQHGIVLEAHQQNTTLLLGADGMQLLLRDNDSPRIHWQHFSQHHPDLAQVLLPLGDERIQTDRPEALADMFITIILHLCITSVLQQGAQAGLLDLSDELVFVRQCIAEVLDQHPGSPFQGTFRQKLLVNEHFPSKRMLSAGTLYPKTELGATDINKCYRHRAPNCLRCP